MINPRVLVVEDNPIDVLMIKRALKIGGLAEEPLVVNDGAPAITLLSGQEPYQDVACPDLVVLDLNLIAVDGGEVLNYIRSSSVLNKVTVAILSSTPTDIVRTTYAEADCYFTKPSDMKTFEGLGKKILHCYEKSKRRE